MMMMMIGGAGSVNSVFANGCYIEEIDDGKKKKAMSLQDSRLVTNIIWLGLIYWGGWDHCMLLDGRTRRTDAGLAQATWDPKLLRAQSTKQSGFDVFRMSKMCFLESIRDISTPPQTIYFVAALIIRSPAPSHHHLPDCND